MISLLRILKPDDVIASSEVYTVPDVPFEPIPYTVPDEQELPQQLDQEQAKIVHKARQEAQVRAQEAAREESYARALQREEQAKAYYEITLRKAREDAEALLARSKEQARQEAEHILQLALAEAETMKKQIEREAYQRAYQDAVTQKSQAIEQKMMEAQQTMADMQEHYTAFTQEYEEQLRWLALDIAAKIMRRQIAQDDTFMLELVKAAVDTVKQAEWMSIKLSEQMTGLIAALEKHLEGCKGRMTARAEVVPGEYEPGTCIIETPEGILDASVDTQLANLRESFQ